MTKTTLYGGSATALFLLGYYFGKRHTSETGDLGVSQLDYTRNMPIFAVKVGKQIAYAQAGKWLTSADEAEDNAPFRKAPAYDARAHLTVAYWTAVAARLLHSRTLAAKAAATLARGNAVYHLPGSSLMMGSAASIMASGLASLKRSATSPVASSAVEALAAAADPSAIRAEQQKRDESSVTALPGKVREALSPANVLKETTGFDLELWAKRAKWGLLLGGLGVGAWVVYGKVKKRRAAVAGGGV